MAASKTKERFWLLFSATSCSMVSSSRLVLASFCESSGLISWDFANGDLTDEALVEVGERVADSGLYTVNDCFRHSSNRPHTHHHHPVDFV